MAQPVLRSLFLLPSFLVLGWFFLAGCSELEAEKPAIPEETLIEVLADLYLLEAQAKLGHEVPMGQRDSVLARHSVSTAAYEATMRFYADRPQEYVELYRDVVNHLNSLTK